MIKLSRHRLVGCSGQRLGRKTQHSLSVSGGNDKLSFYSSAQYMWQDAIYKQSTQDYKQYQFITNIDAKINKSVRFSFDILGRQEQRNRGIYSTPYLFTYFLTTSGQCSLFPERTPTSRLRWYHPQCRHYGDRPARIQ